ncbi:hypothetical protein [Psychroflexus aestuariivivens]|uniref:hypothetical protein n=1 Tax=Psychroflexus aestuariivivens TaxID=1795040 RepID=UPI000FD7ADAA|nr:hypothetical protein [Psychroflexus aestuariivivens]
MKKISTILLGILFLISCEGDRGPAGPPGPPGSGEAIIGNIYEIEADLLPQNNYATNYEFPLDVEVFESDVVMVYLLEEQISDSSGPVDVWTPLPQSFFFNDGSQVVYNFNHTFFDVKIFLNGNTNLDTLPDAFIFNQIFRIAILPADFAENNPNVNLNNLESVMQATNNNEIEKLN